MTRLVLRFLAGAVLVLGTFWNLHQSDVNIGYFETRGKEDVNVIENQYLPIEYWLILNYPETKRIGHISPLTLQGKPPDDLDGLRWGQLRYVMIPRILVRGTDETFVIGYFNVGEPVPPVPDYLEKVYDPGTGMILYKKKTAP